MVVGGVTPTPPPSRREGAKMFGGGGFTERGSFFLVRWMEGKRGGGKYTYFLGGNFVLYPLSRGVFLFPLFLDKLDGRIMY